MASTAEYLKVTKPKMCASRVDELAMTEAKVRPPHSADKNQNNDRTPVKLVELEKSLDSLRYTDMLICQMVTYLRIRMPCASRGDANQRQRHKIPVWQVRWCC